MYATLKFDTEDVYYPPAYRIDDIPGWLAEIMTAGGIRGSFCVFGEKARSLKQRGREDVIAKMAEHDLASHQQGNCRPLIPELLRDAGWADGVEAMRRYEDQVAEDFRRAFGREPVALSRHNLYFAAQHVAVAGERGLPYMTGIIGVEGTQQPTWYAGSLMMPSASTPGFGGFDEIYSNDHAFEQRMKELDQYLADCLQRGVEYLSLFGCHPVRVMARGWIEEYCLASGMTRTPQKVGWLYAVKGPEDEARAQANFGRLVKYLREHPDLEMVGIEQAAGLFSTQPSEISRDELAAYAEQVERAGKPLLHSTFSPAELVCGLAESLVHAGADGGVPYAVPRRDVLGPTSPPVLAREADTITHEQLLAICRQAVESVRSDGHLPAHVQTAGGRIGLGQLALLAARGYLAAAREESYQKLRVGQTQRYHDAAFEIDAWARRTVGEHWALAPEFSCEKLTEHMRLQTWTLKPAWLRPPRGRPRSEGRILI